MEFEEGEVDDVSDLSDDGAMSNSGLDDLAAAAEQR